MGLRDTPPWLVKMAKENPKKLKDLGVVVNPDGSTTITEEVRLFIEAFTQPREVTFTTDAFNHVPAELHQFLTGLHDRLMTDPQSEGVLEPGCHRAVILVYKLQPPVES